MSGKKEEASNCAKSTAKKAMGKKQLDYLKILEKNKGLVSLACKDCKNMSRTTHYTWMKEYEGFKERVEEIDDGNVDFVEGKLLTLINEGDTGATIFYLKCKGKKRGYSEKQEIEHSGNIGTTINIVPASSIVKNE